MRWLALLALALAAGCLESGEPQAESGVGGEGCGPRPDREGLDQDWSKETLTLAIQSDGAFSVEVPLPVSEGGTQAADWVAHVQVPDGWTAVLTTGAADALLRVDGSGDGSVEACSIQPQAERGNGCCAEQYLDAHWTGSDQARSEMDRLDVDVRQGSLGLRVLYTAESNWCGAEGEFAGVALGAGQHGLAGQHQAWCE